MLGNIEDRSEGKRGIHSGVLVNQLSAKTSTKMSLNVEVRRDVYSPLL